ncbi:MAG: NUDIX domain-containing protein [Bacteroidota bacterium]|nr:NUDIX domain-containing protein [Bacteroidota bacterium]
MIFNVRVYGILINDKNQILLSDEYIRGEFYTKFPGGGLEIGEGTRECLKREFKEEMDLAVEVREHFYTTDFYQQSAFNPDHQIISIYYFVTPLEEITFSLTDKEFDFTENQLQVYKEQSEIETFRFIDLKDFSEEKVTLPIDKIVAKLISNRK